MTDVRESEARTRWLMVKPEWQERCISCKRRGAVPSSGNPLPSLTPTCSPNGPKPCPALATEEQKKEMKAEEWEAAVPSVWGRR